EIDYFLFCSPDYKSAHPAIDQLGDIAPHQFVDYIHDGSVSERYRVLEELVSKPKRSFTTNSVLAQRAAAAAGMGLVLLTPYVAMAGNDLVSLLPDQPLIRRNLWIAAPEDLLKIKRYRFVWDHIRNLVAQYPQLFHRPG